MRWCAGEGGEKRLVAYVVGRPSETDKCRCGLCDCEWPCSTNRHTDRAKKCWAISCGGLAAIPASQSQPRRCRFGIRKRCHAARFSPQHVLEIGCGTGLLLTAWRGLRELCWTGFFGEVLVQLRAYLSRRSDLSTRVEARGSTRACVAKDESVDLVILNSVVQYFPVCGLSAGS